MTRLPEWLFVILSCFVSVLSFNLDLDNLVKYRGSPGSMFGFTVAQHSYQSQTSVIVGAPEDETDQPGVTKGGAVYRCYAFGDNNCERIRFDRNGDNRDQHNTPIDNKSNQWFGATLSSSNGSVLACAPRYVYTQKISTEERRDPVGTCWLAKDQLNSTVQEFSPCRNRDWGYHRHGHCQAGLGAALSKDGGRLYIGAPGSCFWQGRIHSQNIHNRADVISSSDGPSSDDDSYLGYSVTSGRFVGGRERPYPSDIAVGVPKGEKLNGKVVLFTYNMTHIRNITGEQLGAYFGYAMASCNVDGDSYDDLIVGAPMYTEEGNDEMFYETGRIYVFYAGHSDGSHVRDGDKNNRARFGHSIACLGDVNRDGYNDIAVGAPYGNDGEGGAVYIYHGSKEGIREKYSQVIKAEDIPGNPLTFGFSVAGGVDMDRNQYPDVSVGAYESNQAFLFKARPVVQMHTSVTFESESKQISLDERNCTLKDRSRVPCVKLDVCLRYEGLGVDSKLPFDIQVLLDARKPKSPRLAFLDQEEGRSSLNETLFLDKGRDFCKAYLVYLKHNIRDKLTSLDAELWYTLITNKNPRATRSLHPVLNANENLSAKDTLAIQKNCGRDNICIPDLRLIARPSVEKYVLGSGKRLEIEVEVQNEGEDAFESTFELQVPSGLNYVKIERKDESEREIPVQCSPPSFNNNYTLRCDIGNPLPKEKLVKFLVLLQPYHQNTMNSTYDFSMVVNSTNPEKSDTGSDNHMRFSVPIWVVTELTISGSSRPVDVYYNSSQYVTDDETKITRESQIGPQVAHLYTITNRGPSEFLKAQATIYWPSNTLTGEPLLYLLEEPETSGDIECHVENDDYNLKKVKIERRGKSFFDAEPGTASAWYSADYETDSDSATFSGGSSASRTSSSSSSRSSSSSSSSGSRVYLTREERLRFEEEERRREEEAAARETGDGSHRHGERIKASSQSKNHYSRTGGRLESDSYSSGSETRDRDHTELSSRPVEGTRYRGEHRSSSSSSWTEPGVPVTRTKSSERTSTTKDGKTETRWREEEDGIVKSGSSVVEHEGSRRSGGRGGIPVGGEIEKSYESHWSKSSSSRSQSGRDGNSDRRATWRAEGDGAVGTGGHRTAEERRVEWNTTHTAGGRPITSEHSSWRKEQDGAVVGSTEHSRTYEGDYSGSRNGEIAGFDERSRSSGRRGWRVDGEERTREDGGTVVFDERTSETSSRRRGHGGGGASRTSEERRSEWTREDGGTAVVGESLSGASTRRRGQTGGSATRTSDERHSEWTREEGESGVVGEATGTASRRRGQGGAGATRSSAENRSEWNTTWTSGSRPVTSEHTSWRKEQDGVVIGSGDHRTTYEGEAAGVVSGSKHSDRASSSNRNVSWKVEGEGMTREGGTVSVDDATLDVSSRRRNQGGVSGTRTAEEKRTEWNTTWSSGGRPVTSEHTSWRKEQDGAVIGSGDHTRTYEGTAARDKVELERRLKEQLERRITSVASTRGSSGAVDTEIDQNLIAGGGGAGTTYKKEWEEHYNTTWGTSTGGKPVTVAKTKWTVEEDGTVRTGGDTKTYEGVAPGTAGTTITFPSGTSQGHGRAHHESRVHSSSGAAAVDSGLEVSSVDRSESAHRSETSRSGSAHTGSGRRHHFSTESEDGVARAGEASGTYYAAGSSGVSSSGSHHHRAESSLSEEERAAQSHKASSASESERRAYSHRSGSDSGRRTHSHGEEAEYSETGYADSERRTHGHRAGEARYSGSERRTHGSGSSSAASSIGESSGASSSFDFGAVARGPGDGKARTYVTDLGILTGGASSSSAGAAGSRTVQFSAAEGESGRHQSGTREKHYSFGSDTGARDEGSDSYSSSVHGSGGRSSGGSSYSSGTRYASSSRSSGTRNFEGDPDLDPDYESRKAGSSSSSSHSYSRSYSSRDGTYEAGSTDDDHRSISNQDDRQGFRHYRRDRRQVDDYDSYDPYDDYDEEETSKKCSGPVRCTRIVCNIGALKKDQEVHVAIRSRLWLATIKKIAPHVETVLGSEMTAKVTLLPTIGRPSQKTMTKNSTEIKTRIMTEPLTQPDVVPLWIVVLSAVSGALILMLLVYILYKLGFFKRNRPEPSTGSEKTPLNRNGHYQGDEPL